MAYFMSFFASSRMSFIYVYTYIRIYMYIHIYFLVLRFLSQLKFIWQNWGRLLKRFDIKIKRLLIISLIPQITLFLFR